MATAIGTVYNYFTLGLYLILFRTGWITESKHLMAVKLRPKHQFNKLREYMKTKTEVYAKLFLLIWSIPPV